MMIKFFAIFSLSALVAVGASSPAATSTSSSHFTPHGMVHPMAPAMRKKVPILGGTIANHDDSLIISQISRGGVSGSSNVKETAIIIHAVACFILSLVSVLASFGINVPFVGLTTAMPDYELTTVTAFLQRLISVYLLGIGLWEIQGYHEERTQAIFVTYHIPLVLFIVLNAIQVRTVDAWLFIVLPGACLLGAMFG